MKKEILFFDTETTGLPEKGIHYERDFTSFPYIVSISWKFKDVEKDYIIKPEGYVIPEAASQIHGITTKIALEKGVDFSLAINIFLNDCMKADKICAYNIYFDTSIIKANCNRYDFIREVVTEILHKSKRLDPIYVATGIMKLTQSGSNRSKFPNLLELHKYLFGVGFEAHNSMSDVLALERCYNRLIELGYEI